jgi:hypothetical protein
MDKVKVCDLDFVYISFNEPNKEENWADIKNKVPWAKRVDGVVGFDSAHKAAAELAETEFFISVDGDNILHQRFLLQSLDFSLTNPNAVHRWRAENSVNGLIYGNGGLVGWPKQTCLDMKTHENADKDENQIDFCWGVPHDILKVRDLDQLGEIYSQRTKGIDINEELLMYGESLRQRLDIPVAEYDSNESKFFKYAMLPHKNLGVQTRER